MRALVDNDVLLKGACYGLLPAFMATVSGDGPIGILGTSRFVVPKQITRQSLHTDSTVATAHFTAFIAENNVIEPTPSEQQIAAQFEAAAQQIALNLDAGESQLLGVLVSRCLPWLLTGDKRAIVSIEILLDRNTHLMPVIGKIKCLEQLVLSALTIAGPAQMQVAICAEPDVDKALSICFSCRSKNVGSTLNPSEGLNSYIVDLRTVAPRVLATS